MSQITEVTTPVVGMVVVWVDPDEAGDNARFVEHVLIRKYGGDGFIVATVTERPGAPGRDRWLVTLERDGRPIVDEWDEEREGRPAPKSFEPKVTTLSWAWLKPAT